MEEGKKKKGRRERKDEREGEKGRGNKNEIIFKIYLAKHYKTNL